MSCLNKCVVFHQCLERDVDGHSANGVAVGTNRLPIVPVAPPVPLGKGARHCETVSVTVSVTVSGAATGHDAAPVGAGGIEVTTKDVAPVKGTLTGPNKAEVAMLMLDSGPPVGSGRTPVPPITVELGKKGEPVPVPVGKNPVLPLPVGLPEGTIPVALATINVGKLDAGSY